MLNQNAGLARDWALFYAAEILVGLKTVHEANIIFRDLKPENVMIDAQGHAKLIDFGFAKQMNGTARATTNCGTLGYTAPEVL